MTNQEARDYIYWYNNKVDEYHYKAHFKSSRPFHVDNPTAGDKLIEAKIQLGKFQWQRPYEDIKRIYPSVTLEIYNEYRKKYKL